MPYQPTWLNGRQLGSADRPCADRYEVIRMIAAQYRRPITVLDLGCAEGYFGTRLAEEFGAVSVLIDDGDAHLDTLAANDLPTTLALKRRMSVKDLEELAACEHFDLVLALNVVHHFKDWRGALSAVLRLGEQVVLETPPAEDTGACGGHNADLYDACLDEAPRLLGLFPAHTTPGVLRPLFHFARPKPELAKPYFGAERMGAPRMREHTILSSPGEKWFVMPAKDDRHRWIPGINLWTWAQLGGAYPSMLTVQQNLYREFHRALSGSDPKIPTFNVSHGDCRPWNWIISGQALTLIDWKDPRQVDTPDAEGLSLTLAWIEHPERACPGRAA